MTITDDMVERAAAAAWNLHATRPWAEIPEAWKPAYRDKARVALEAANVGCLNVTITPNEVCPHCGKVNHLP